MADFKRRVCLSLLLGAWLVTTGCQKNIVVLLADPDGGVGRITVTNEAGSIEMANANASTAIRDAETAPSPPVIMDKKDIDNLFGGVLANQPPLPVHYLLYFETDATELQPASRALLKDIVATIEARRSQHVSVVGHSDTLGNKSYNLELSRRRAAVVKNLLIQNGISETRMVTTSHGEENPLVKTADNVGNAKNRRVEVVVR